MATEVRNRTYLDSRNPCRRKLATAVMGSILCLLTSVTFATTSVNSVVLAKVDPIPLYANPDGKNQTGSAPASSLPWTVEDDRNDFYKVSIGGKHYWVDSMDVHANMYVTAKCSRGAGPGGPVAADFGASSNRCK
ncbi:hypothetical protein [Paraburkholderia caribensis]|uniref:hypothetical protein n=1 Tax=Paraburkholderia caribensis TaxID=75105 RepID=UPI00159140F3|nr:hypothetical protein [Paraburkholderia caribensis]